MTKPKETAFLKIAKDKGCSTIYGYQMFTEQALGQFDLWFKNRVEIQDCRKNLEKMVIDCLNDQKE